MDRRKLNLLLVSDDDLECNSDSITLTDLGIKNLGFNEEDLKEFELIVYSGKRGVKILRSKYFRSGKIL